MKTNYEIRSDKNKIYSTLGYGIVWFFVAFSFGVLPFITNNNYNIFYIPAGIALLVGIYKTIVGTKKLSN